MNCHRIRNKITEVVFVLGIVLICSIPSFGQSPILINREYDQLFWKDFMEKIELNYNARFFYKPNLIPDFNISIKNDSTPLKEVLLDNLKPFQILISIDDARNIFLSKGIFVETDLLSDFFPSIQFKKDTINSVNAIPIDNDFFLKATDEYIAKTIKIGTREKGMNGKTALISGFIKNAATSEPIIGATILQKDLGTGIATNAEGFFNLNIKKGKHILTVNSVNMVEKRIEVEVLSDGVLDILLDEKIVMLDDVVISAQAYSKVKGTQMGLEKIAVQSIKKIPLVFGERDIIKVALLLPGVQSVGEGSSGFNVRGSPTDQNMFYVNNVPIYNTSHVAGFFSAFNSDAISEFSLYKNNIPINYGGRLASVFDIKTKQGSLNKLKVNGGIGIITGRILAEGPIKKDKSSFLVAVRSTYSDWILNMVDDVKIRKSKVKFADAITNFSFQLNENNQLNIFSYFSNDEMDMATRTKYDYQNYGATLNWKHYFKKKHNFELSLIQSNYAFNEENTEVLNFSYKHLNKVTHHEMIAKFNIVPQKNHSLVIGANAVLYEINRGNPMPLTNESQFMPIELGKEKGLESGIFLSDEWKISPKLTVNGGFRYNRYTYLGPQEVYTYAEGFPKSEGAIEDTLFFKNNEPIKTYQGLDFRIASNYMLNDDLSFKMAYNRLHQYMYMLSNTVAIAPNYKWKLIDYNTKPMIGDQISAGMFANILANRYELSVETYYKKIKNLVELKNGASLFLNEFIEQSVLQGKLDAFGIEFMLKKLRGSTTGWINYTYSGTSVQVDNKIPENRINFGLSYPSNYDKPHALNMVVNHTFSRQFSMSANFVYATGRPITYPVSLYFQNGIKYLNYSERNEYRIPDYIRLDLSFTIEGNLRRHKIAHGSWNLSIYNLLGRKNAYSVYFVQENNLIKGNKFSVFGAPIFSLTYNFKLGNYDS